MQLLEKLLKRTVAALPGHADAAQAEGPAGAAPIPPYLERLQVAYRGPYCPL